MKYTIANVSCGKDSLAMVEEHIKRGRQLDEVVMYDTGMEFQAIYDTWAKLTARLDEIGIKHTVLYPAYPFRWDMLERLVTRRDGSGTYRGYGWCGGRCRWGTTAKTSAMDKYAKSKDAIVLVGIAADEKHRMDTSEGTNKRYPLVEYGMSEADCLASCYAMGYEWRESGACTPDGTIRLYDILARVSCWCCRNKNLKELRNIRRYLPEHWEGLKELQGRLDQPMKGAGKSVFDLDVRYRLEDEWQGKGLNIRSRKFFKALHDLQEAGKDDRK